MSDKSVSQRPSRPPTRRTDFKNLQATTPEAKEFIGGEIAKLISVNSGKSQAHVAVALCRAWETTPFERLDQSLESFGDSVASEIEIARITVADKFRGNHTYFLEQLRTGLRNLLNPSDQKDYDNLVEKNRRQPYEKQKKAVSDFFSALIREAQSHQTPSTVSNSTEPAPTTSSVERQTETIPEWADAAKKLAATIDAKKSSPRDILLCVGWTYGGQVPEGTMPYREFVNPYEVQRGQFTSKPSGDWFKFTDALRGHLVESEGFPPSLRQLFLEHMNPDFAYEKRRANFKSWLHASELALTGLEKAGATESGIQAKTSEAIKSVIAKLPSSTSQVAQEAAGVALKVPRWATTPPPKWFQDFFETKESVKSDLLKTYGNPGDREKAEAAFDAALQTRLIAIRDGAEAAPVSSQPVGSAEGTPVASQPADVSVVQPTASAITAVNNKKLAAEIASKIVVANTPRLPSNGEIIELQPGQVVVLPGFHDGREWSTSATLISQGRPIENHVKEGRLPMLTAWYFDEKWNQKPLEFKWLVFTEGDKVPDVSMGPWSANQHEEWRSDPEKSAYLQKQEASVLRPSVLSVEKERKLKIFDPTTLKNVVGHHPLVIPIAVKPEGQGNDLPEPHVVYVSQADSGESQSIQELIEEKLNSSETK